MKQEEFRIEGKKLLQEIKKLAREGTVRRIIIKTKDGKEILSVPLWLGAAGAVLAPGAVAIGAIAGLASEWILVVERDDDTDHAG